MSIFTSDDVLESKTLDCDVCVVGSGAGGAFMAYELVAAGKSVVLLEEGGYFTRRDFKMREADAFLNLYQELGNRATEDLSISILQGRSVGGGTTVNWTSSFRTPRRILEHWKNHHGIEGLTEEVLTPHWEAIEKRLHIQEWPEAMQNRNNQVLYEGLGKLRYHRGLIRRNVHNCLNIGYCGMGCPVDAKQSMSVTLLPDAVEKGLQLYANASVRRLEYVGRRVTAVHADILHAKTQKPTGKTLTVRAKQTVVCAGAINSPALLLRSGLDAGGLTGRRTFLHPVVVMMAEFDAPIRGFEGAPQSVYSHQFLERGEGRLGFFLEVPPIHPLLAATTSTGFGPSHQETMARLPYMQACLGLVVDGLLPEEEGGTVSLRDEGYSRPRISYPLKEIHFEAFREACREMAKIQFAAGARRVISCHTEPVHLSSVADLPLLEKATFVPLQLRVVTAHQMGGCAMGGNRETSVVDARLRYHDLDNLYVADGSVLPTALGVNPQLTLFGLARWGAQHVLSAM